MKWNSSTASGRIRLQGASQLGANGKVRWLSKQLEQLQRKWKTLSWGMPLSHKIGSRDIHAGQSCLQKTGIKPCRLNEPLSRGVCFSHLAKCDAKEACKRTGQPLRSTPLLLASLFSDRRRRRGKDFKGQRVPCHPCLPSRRAGTSM